MHTTTQGKQESENRRSGATLGRCLVDGDPDMVSNARQLHRKSFAVSLGIDLLLLGLLVATPLLSSVAKPKFRLAPPAQLAFFGTWRQHDPVQHAVPNVNVHTPAIHDQLQLPGIFNNTSPRPVEESGEVSAPGIPDGYVPGSVISDKPVQLPPPEPPRIAHPVVPEKRVLKLSEGIVAAQLVSRIEPRYPSLAVQTKTEGTVRLHAIISRDGSINSLDVISGHPLLVQAALEAVRQWRYRPTMLSGEPVEVETFITVVFRLHG